MIIYRTFLEKKRQETLVWHSVKKKTENTPVLCIFESNLELLNFIFQLVPKT